MRGDTPPGLPLASQRPGAARRAGNTHRERDRQTPCRQQGGRDTIRRREVARRLQVRAVAQQATVHPPAQDQQHGKPYHRRGGHRREERHEFFRVCRRPLGKYRPAGQGPPGKEDRHARKRTPGIRARQIIEPLQAGADHGEDREEQRPDTAYRQGSGTLQGPRRVQRGRLVPQSRETERAGNLRPQAHRETAQPYRRNGTHARQARTHREPLRVRAARPERNDRERRARPGAEPFLCPG